MMTDEATEKLLEDVRLKAEKVLSSLQRNKACDMTQYESWIRGVINVDKNCSDSQSLGSKKSDEAQSFYPSERCQLFDQYGFILVSSFSEISEVEAMKSQMKTLVDKNWFPGEEKTAVFRTDEKQIDAQGSNDYFLESASRIHFFAEKEAMDDQSGTLNEKYANDKMSALNKAGHGMHTSPGAFHDYTVSLKVKKLVRELGWTNPVVPQSMYIFKQPKIGGEVTSHQDSTFLFTKPRQSCLGLWLALDDATLENGCLWVRPSSHRENVRRKFVRNIEHFGSDSINARSNLAKGDTSKPQMVFEKLVEEDDFQKVPWEGKLPSGSHQLPYDGLFENGFVPVECKAGDLLVFVGQLDHLSLPNFSSDQRHTFQLHLVEGENAGVTWDQSNWLQYPKNLNFLEI